MNEPRADKGNGPSLELGHVLDEKLFTFLLNLEVHKATRLQYCVSVFCLTPNLPAREVAPTLLNRLAQAAICHLRTTDVVASFPPSCVALLLVDAETRTLPLILQRLKEDLEVQPLNVSGQLRRITLSAGGGCYPQTATSGSELLRQAVDLMGRAKEVGGGLYLPT